jgi:hypothetical protein
MINYKGEAELYVPKGRGRKGGIAHKRFNSTAKAVQWAIEELSPNLLSATYLEVDEQRFDGEGIRRLYNSTAYPLKRRKLKE